MEIKRGQIYYTDFSPVVGCEQGGRRPALILQNNSGNIHSPTTIVAPLTSVMGKNTIPTHVKTKATKYPSLILLEQIRVVDKSRIYDYLGELDEKTMKEVDRKIAISLGL